MAGCSRKKFKKVKTRSRRPLKFFVEGGALADWAAIDSPPSRGMIRNGNTKAKNNWVAKSKLKDLRRKAVALVYPRTNSQKISNADRVEGGENILEKSPPIVLVDSTETPIIAYIDEGPQKAAENMEYTYDYSASFMLDDNSHGGLGFHDELDPTTSGIGTPPKMEVQERSSFDPLACDEDIDTYVGRVTGLRSASEDEVLGESENSPPQENSGFLSIGGMRIYTQDLSDEVEEDLLDEVTSENSTWSFESDDCYNTGSDIDEEVAADYFEGIDGSDNIVDLDEMVEHIAGVSDDDSFSDGIYDETLKGKLFGNSLQDAWWEYGMEKPSSRRKSRAEKHNPTPAKYVSSPALDTLMLVKSPKTVSGRKKHPARLPKSWSLKAQKSTRFRKESGKKRNRHKEMKTVKRGETMTHRGINLLQINSTLEKMVLDGLDVFSFQPMHSQDCAQVQSLAAIYRLQSGCHIYGKKRFVTVMRTQHTGMPSSLDRVRLEKLIRANNTGNDRKTSRGSRVRNESRKKKKHDKTGSYASQPLSFVSSGVIHSQTVELKSSESNETSDICNEKGPSSAVNYGEFELHTTGFGSKMMAKMGYIEGGGLGKEGQGIAVPVQVFQRPKSLGLGAEIPETSDKSTEEKGHHRKSHRHSVTDVFPRSDKSTEEKGHHRKSRRRSVTGVFPRSDKFANEEAQGFAAFEKHTMGFGSRMMTRMGFVEGMGLGKDTQGIVNPLVAVRRPKCQGLGANGRNSRTLIR